LTIYEATQHGKDAIGQHETRLLLSHITGLDQVGLLLNDTKPLSIPSKEAFFAAINRRIANEPLQYILGWWEFMGLAMKTDPRALIPRPETELLVEEALAFIKNIAARKTNTHISQTLTHANAKNRQDRSKQDKSKQDKSKHNKNKCTIKVLDVCTGSGCIAVAIAKLAVHISATCDINVDVTAIDISHDALALAKENAVSNQVSDKIHFMQSDLLDGLDIFAHPSSHGSDTLEHLFTSSVNTFSNPFTYDLIISNPPYIPTAELKGLKPELDHEPKLALDGGKDGLDLYRRLIPQTIKHLAPDGALMLEIGPKAVEAITKAAGYGIVKVLSDYAGLDRMIIAHKTKFG